MNAPGLAKPQLEIADDVRDGQPLAGEVDTAAARAWLVQQLRLLWEQRRWFSRAAVAGLVFGAILVFALPKRYEASTQLMPPDNQSTSAMGLLAGLSGAADRALGNAAGDLLGQKSSGALFIGILRSRTVEDSLVDRFQLTKAYGTHLEQDAQQELQDNTAISEDRKSGIITIAVTDRSPQRATAMAQEYVEELNRVVTDLNTSSAHRERVFLEGRLAEVRQDLESAEKGFSEFASKNTAIDIQAQGKAMIESAATLEGQLVAAQTELQGLKQIYAGDNVRVRTIQARVDELDRQLQKLGGKFDTPSATDGLGGSAASDPTMYPSIRELPLLGVSYADLYVNPQPTPEELREFYASYDDGEQWRSREEHFNRGVRRAVLRSKPSGMVLDIGCGSGNFLRCMKEVGFSAFGIEPSESGSDFAREEHGIEIYCGMIEEYFASRSTRQFDVVTLLNVLEHLSDPSRTLGQVRQILACDGVLAIVVPDARFHDLLGRLRRTFGLPNPYWLEQSGSVLAGFKLPDHLCSFQPRTIAALVENCGFRLITMENAPLVFNARAHRNLGKMLVRWTSQALHYGSFGRVLVGYSTLVLARKQN